MRNPQRSGPGSELARLRPKGAQTQMNRVSDRSQRLRSLSVALVAAVVASLTISPAFADHIDSEQFPHTHTDDSTSGFRGWAGKAAGTVVDLNVGLPPAILAALDENGVASPVGDAIVDVISSSSVEAERTEDTLVGIARSFVFDPEGTIGGIVDEVAGPVPFAEATLDDPPARAALASVNNTGISVGISEVTARASQLSGMNADVRADSALARVSVTLGELLDSLPAGGAEARAAVRTLLAVLYGGDGNPAASVLPDGVVGEINNQIGAIEGLLESNDDLLESNGFDASDLVKALEIRLPTLTEEDLLDNPLVSFGKLVTGTSVTAPETGDLAGYKVASATASVLDLEILAGLVSADLIQAEAGVAVKVGEAKTLEPVQRIVGLSIGDGTITLDSLDLRNGLKINGQSLSEFIEQLPAGLGDEVNGALDTVLGLTEQLLGMLGVSISTPPPVSDTEAGDDGQSWRASQDVTALLVSVHPLAGASTGVGEVDAALAQVRDALPTVDVKLSTASAKAGINVPLVILGECIGQCNPSTGVATNVMTLTAGLLIAAAVLLKRFALAKP